MTFNEAARFYIYPVGALAAYVWAVWFWRHWRNRRCTSARWAFLLAMMVGTTWLISFGSLVSVAVTGQRGVWSYLFTAALIVMMALLVVGAVRVWVRGWRRSLSQRISTTNGGDLENGVEA